MRNLPVVNRIKRKRKQLWIVTKTLGCERHFQKVAQLYQRIIVRIVLANFVLVQKINPLGRFRIDRQFMAKIFFEEFRKFRLFIVFVQWIPLFAIHF